MEAQYITITVVEYEELLEAFDWLQYLKAAGVDNWEGVAEAHQYKREEEERRGKGL